MENKLKESPLELLWIKEINEGISKVAFANDNIVVGTKDGRIKCFGLDGGLKWKHEVGIEIISISASNSHLVVSSKDSNTYLFNLSGNLKWKRQHETYGGVCRISNEYILIGCSLFDLNGNLKWEEYISFASSYLSDNYVAFISNAEDEMRCVYLFDLNGKLKWIADIEEEGADVSIFEEEYVVASDDWNFYLFDIKGKLLLDSKLLLKESRIAYNDVKVLSAGIGVNFSNLWDNHLLALGSNYGDVALLDIKEKKLKWERKIFKIPEEDVKGWKSIRDLEIPEYIWDISQDPCTGISVIIPYICNEFVIFKGGYPYATYLFDMNGKLKWKQNLEAFVDHFKDNLLFIDTNIIYLYQIKHKN